MYIPDEGEARGGVEASESDFGVKPNFGQLRGCSTEQGSISTDNAKPFRTKYHVPKAEIYWGKSDKAAALGSKA